MKCPICGFDMENGGLIADGAFMVSWQPVHEFENKGLKGILYRDGKRIGQAKPLFRMVKIPNAWYCKDCNKVVGLFDVE